MPDSWLMALDWFGTAIFAVTGALVASRKRMDIFGFILLGAATGIGGGSLRDLMLGQLPVFWVKEPVSLAICIVVSAATFFLAHIPESRYRTLLSIARQYRSNPERFGIVKVWRPKVVDPGAPARVPAAPNPAPGGTR